MDVKPCASRAARVFLIAFEAQLRERMSHGEDSRGARTLSDDSKGEGYFYERRSSRIVSHLGALKKRKACLSKSEHYVSRTPLVKMEFKHSIE